MISLQKLPIENLIDNLRADLDNLTDYYVMWQTKMQKSSSNPLVYTITI